jgi:serine/threonine-protein kinase HipA
MKTTEQPKRRRSAVSQMGTLAGYLEEMDDGVWSFTYCPDYIGPAVSLTMPLRSERYTFDRFPSVFEGLLPEGVQLEAVLRKHKIDRDDPYGLLIVVGADLVGSLTIEPCLDPNESVDG